MRRSLTYSIPAVNPARAGMIPLCVDPCVWLCGKPRACGDDPVLAPVFTWLWE